MQTHAILNTKQNIQFRSNTDLEKAHAFVNLNDAQLRKMAYTDEDRAQDKRAKRNIAATFLAMPIVDSISSGVLATEKVAEAHLITPIGIFKDEIRRPAEMSTRYSRTARTAIGWVYALGMIGIYSAIKHQVVKNSPNSQRFEKDHPVLAFAMDIGLILGISILGAMGLGKLAQKAGKNYPKSAKEIGEKLETKFKKIDKGNFNQKTLPKWVEGFAKFEKSAPFLAKTGKFVLANSVWVLLGAAITQMIVHSNKKQDNFAQRYEFLKMAQLETAKSLVKTTNKKTEGVEKN